MNPLHQRTTGGAPATSELVPEAHGYGFIAASEAPTHAQSPAPNVQSAPPKVTLPAQQAPEPAPAAASSESAEVEKPLIEFITPEPAPLETEPATASVVLSPLLPNIVPSDKDYSYTTCEIWHYRLCDKKQLEEEGKDHEHTGMCELVNSVKHVTWHIKAKG